MATVNLFLNHQIRGWNDVFSTRPNGIAPEKVEVELPKDVDYVTFTDGTHGFKWRGVYTEEVHTHRPGGTAVPYLIFFKDGNVQTKYLKVTKVLGGVEPVD